MKTYDQRKQCVEAYLKKAKARKFAWNCIKTVASATCLVAIVIGLLHIPYGRQNAAVIPTENSSKPAQTHSTGVPTEPTVPTGTQVPPDDTTPNNTEPSTDTRESMVVKIWVPEENGLVDLMYAQIQRFNETMQCDVRIEATIEAVFPGDVDYYLTADMHNGADLFCIHQEDMSNMMELCLLQQLSTESNYWIKENHHAFAYSVVYSDQNAYAFPMNLENSYVLYYDKSVISPEDVDSLESIIAACEASGRKFSYSIDNGYYLSAFFFATGCHSKWFMKNGEFVGLDDTFDSEEGLIALQGVMKLLSSDCFQSPGNSNISYEECYKQSAAIVDGLWNHEMIGGIFGDNLGVACLPSFTVDEKSYSLRPFGNSVLMGIKPQTDPLRLQVLEELAKFLQSEDCQAERYAQFEGMIPTHYDAQGTITDLQVTVQIAQFFNAEPISYRHGSWYDVTSQIAGRLQNGEAPADILAWYSDSMDKILGGT